MEFSVAGHITDAWQVFGGLMLLKSERKHDAYLDLVRRTASPGDYGTFLTTNGDELAFTPRVTGNLWTTYRFPVGLTLGAGLQYVGSSWLAPRTMRSASSRTANSASCRPIRWST